MKKQALSIILLLSLLFIFSACTGKIKRGKWEDNVYYNAYGQFSIVTNSYFTIYTDKEIKRDLGAVYQSDYVLNDMLISSDYCAVIVTIEKTSDEYTQSAYVEQFILNTQRQDPNGLCEMGEPLSETIADKEFTCVPIRYTLPSSTGEGTYYYEFDYIYKAENGIFITIRITAGTEGDIITALGMIKSY